MSYNSEHPPTCAERLPGEASAFVPNAILQGRLVLALQRASAYLLSKQSSSGGFCFYRGYYLEESNLADTWHGLAALCNLLRAPVPQQKQHAEFIIGQPVEPQPFSLYCRVRSLRVLDVIDPHAAEVRRAVEALQPSLSDAVLLDAPEAALNRLRYTIWLKRYFGAMPPLDHLMSALLGTEHAQGGYGVPPNLIDTAAAVAVLTFCGDKASARSGDFVARLAEPSCGFRLTLNSLSPNLETTCAGIIACAEMRLPVPHAAEAVAFILTCQTGNGGFARASDALPSIVLTHLALVALAKCVSPQKWHDMVDQHGG